MLSRLLSRVMTLLLVAGLCAGLYWTLVSSATASVPPSAGAEPPLVRVAAVVASPAHVERTFYGVVRSDESAALGFAQPGRVLERPVDVGQTVAEGDIIAVLDQAPLRHAVQGAQAQVQELEAQRAQLERDLERARNLVAAELGTDAAVEQIESAIDRLDAGLLGARTAVNEARRVERDAVLRAPWSGEVTDVLVEPGEVVGAGSPIVLLSGGSNLEVRIDVPENVFAVLEPGQTVQVAFPMADLPEVEATITEVGHAGSAQARLFPVTLELPASLENAGAARMADGMSAQVRLLIPADPGIQVPVASIVSPTGTEAHVWAVREQTVEQIPVEPVRVDGDLVTIRGALLPGDSIILSGVHRVSAGMQVRVAN